MENIFKEDELNKKKLLELKDGYIYNIEDDFDHCVTGCPTCGLDDEYISSITFEGKFNGELKSISIKTVGYFEYEFSVADVLRLLLNNISEIKNMTYIEFENWLEDNLLK